MATATLAGAALWYARSGVAIFPVRPKSKIPAVAHWKDDATTDEETVKTWWKENPNFNIGMPTGRKVDVLDIDGPRAREALIHHLKTLPIVGRARTARDGEGEHIFLPATGFGNNNRDFDRAYPDADYRGLGGFAVVAPSVGETGRAYKWVQNPDFNNIPEADTNHPFYRPFRTPTENTSPSIVEVFASEYIDYDAERELNAACGALLTTREGGRNSELNRAAFIAAGLVAAGRIEESEARERLQIAAERAGLGAHETERTIESGFSAGLKEPRHRNTESVVATDWKERFQSGLTIMEAPKIIPAVWGDGDNVLWSEGEALMIAASPGVGKTTIAGQVVRARLGLQEEVLGLRVKATEKKVLYLAMDRARQIQRSLRRHFTEQDSTLLQERFVWYPGYRPGDFSENKELLVQMANHVGADTVIVDSLKDAVSQLLEDKQAAGWNDARQYAIGEGIEILELHHLVKRGNGGGAPKELADVYGSAWLTAGIGSCIILVGKAGNPEVEMRHLKQPADQVGPWKLRHDHKAGVTHVLGEINEEADQLAAMIQQAQQQGLTPESSIRAIREEMKLGYPKAKQFLEDWQSHTEAMGTGPD